MTDATIVFSCGTQALNTAQLFNTLCFISLGVSDSFEL